MKIKGEYAVMIYMVLDDQIVIFYKGFLMNIHSINYYPDPKSAFLGLNVWLNQEEDKK